HGWRKGSDKEAALLRNLGESHSLPFHTKQVQLNGRLSEEKGRRERLLFFKKIFEDTGAQAVLLGHHAKDQAETILKRRLEGGGMWNKRGMQEICAHGNLVLWRPPLSTPKEEILRYLRTA